MAISDTLSTIFQIGYVIYQQNEMVKGNKYQCDRLSRRIKLVLESIKNLETYYSDDKFESYFIEFHRCLLKSKELIEKFSDKNWFMHMLMAGTDKQEFSDLNEQLSDIISKLQLSLQIEIFNRNQDKQDQENDYKELCENQLLIFELLKNHHAKQCDMAKSHELHLQKLSEQFQSIQLQVAQLNPNKNEKHPEWLKTVLIPYYQLVFVEKVSDGTIGSTYKGYWGKQIVAIKTVSLTLDSTNHDIFKNEARVMNCLRNDHIQSFYGISDEPDRVCIITEWMANGSLYKQLISVKWNLETKNRVALEIAKGLHALHLKNILHRNLTSHTVFLSENYTVKLGGFGFSKIRSDTLSTKSNDTERQLYDRKLIAWIPPEIRERKNRYTEQSDIYRLGVILWEIAHERPASYQHNIGQFECIENTLFSNLIRQCWSLDPLQRPTLDKIIETLQSKASEVSLTDPSKTNDPLPSLIQINSIESSEEVYLKATQYETEKNYASAVIYYLKAIEKEHIPSYANLGTLLVKERVQLPDKNSTQYGFQLLLHAAYHGHLRAQYNIAYIYEKGQGNISLDLNQAIYWYQKVAQQSPTNPHHQELIHVARNKCNRYSTYQPKLSLSFSLDRSIMTLISNAFSKLPSEKIVDYKSLSELAADEIKITQWISNESPSPPSISSPYPFFS